MLTAGLLPRLQAQTGAPGGVATGLVAWQKANDGVSTNAVWQDSSVGNNDASQATAGSRPVFVTGAAAGSINFNAVFDFDGTNDFFTYTNALGISGTSDLSSFFAFRQDAATRAVLLGDATAGPNQFTAVVQAARYYADHGGFDPSLSWEQSHT